MAQAADRPPVTRWLAARATKVRFEDLPPDAVTLARHCMLDWFAVTIAGAAEPAVSILRAVTLADDAAPAATVIGWPQRSSATNAALINGTASHALDFDDVNMAILGHPTVAIMPGLLALAEVEGTSERDFIAAFVAGYDIACRVGLLVGPSHYEHGFHATSTVGSIGAAAACARVLGLDEAQTANAYGIAATLASGLKSMFGTMCKPLHAGRAAQNGIIAARLAQRGFSSRDDALECAQGFAATQSADFNFGPAMQPAPLDLHLRQNLFKYHASCYLTHGVIEAGRALRATAAVAATAIEAIEIRVAPVTDRVCNIAAPRTGLEAKFSLSLTTAMALAGRDTSAIAAFSDGTACDPELTRLRDKVRIVFDPDYPEAKGTVRIETVGGKEFSASHDAGIANTDLLQQQARLGAKFMALVKPALGQDRADALQTAISSLGHGGSIGEILALVESRQ